MPEGTGQLCELDACTNLATGETLWAFFFDADKGEIKRFLWVCDECREKLDLYAAGVAAARNTPSGS